MILVHSLSAGMTVLHLRGEGTIEGVGASPPSLFLSLSNRGMPGPQGPAGATTLTGTAGALALSGHRVVKPTAGGLEYCDAGIAGDADTAIGITTQAASAGASVSFQASGELEESSWSWTVGGLVYCAPNGVLTQSYSSAWAFVQVVGVASAPTKLAVQIRPAALQI